MLGSVHIIATTFAWEGGIVGAGAPHQITDCL